MSAFNCRNAGSMRRRRHERAPLWLMLYERVYTPAYCSPMLRLLFDQNGVLNGVSTTLRGCVQMFNESPSNVRPVIHDIN